MRPNSNNNYGAAQNESVSSQVSQPQPLPFADTKDPNYSYLVLHYDRSILLLHLCQLLSRYEDKWYDSINQDPARRCLTCIRNDLHALRKLNLEQVQYIIKQPSHSIKYMRYFVRINQDMTNCKSKYYPVHQPRYSSICTQHTKLAECKSLDDQLSQCACCTKSITTPHKLYKQTLRQLLKSIQRLSLEESSALKMKGLITFMYKIETILKSPQILPRLWNHVLSAQQGVFRPAMLITYIQNKDNLTYLTQDISQLEGSLVVHNVQSAPVNTNTNAV